MPKLAVVEHGQFLVFTRLASALQRFPWTFEALSLIEHAPDCISANNARSSPCLSDSLYFPHRRLVVLFRNDFSCNLENHAYSSRRRNGCARRSMGRTNAIISICGVSSAAFLYVPHHCISTALD